MYCRYRLKRKATANVALFAALLLTTAGCDCNGVGGGGNLKPENGGDLTTTQPPEEELPDLTIDNVWWSPETVLPSLSDPVSFTIVVSNQSNAPASGFFVWLEYWTYEGEHMYSQSQPLSLGPGEVTKVYISPYTATSGLYTFKFLVDPGMEIPESNENNNIETVGITINP